MTLLGLSPSYAQVCQGFLYGEVFLKNGSAYRGQLRWGREEALWDDMFDAYKYEHPETESLAASTRQRQEQGEDFSFGFMELWKDKGAETHFSFRCNFGDIASLNFSDPRIVQLHLRNGRIIKIKNDNSGDLNDKLRIYDEQLGRLDVSFKDVASIHFQANPEHFTSTIGDPMYGRVLTTQGVFEGFITWDLEECLGKDLISGRQNGVKIDIEFENITEISTQQDGSLVKLRSGKTIFLNKHDDVDAGNHGILIRNLAFGKLEVAWDNFISVTFFTPPKPPISYREFSSPSLLRGSVTTHQGGQYRGQIIYDLDEVYDMEILNGRNNGFAYFLPFGNIRRIEPQNDKYSLVTLQDGPQLLLGDHSDVSATNHGLVLKLYNGSTRYIAWKEVKRIDFE